jgi:H+/gluconate symporter-like permease
MDFSKIKDNKVLKWTLIIALPTVLVAGYYGYKYLKDKKLDKGEKEKTKEEETEKVNVDGVESESELEFHKIILPSKDKDSSLINKLKSKGISYKLIGIKTVSGVNNEPIFEYNLGINKKDFEEFEKIVNDIRESLKPKEVENS